MTPMERACRRISLKVYGIEGVGDSQYSIPTNLSILLKKMCLPSSSPTSLRHDKHHDTHLPASSAAICSGVLAILIFGGASAFFLGLMGAFAALPSFFAPGCVEGVKCVRLVCCHICHILKATSSTYPSLSHTVAHPPWQAM